MLPGVGRVLTGLHSRTPAHSCQLAARRPPSEAPGQPGNLSPAVTSALSELGRCLVGGLVEAVQRRAYPDPRDYRWLARGVPELLEPLTNVASSPSHPP